MHFAWNDGNFYPHPQSETLCKLAVRVSSSGGATAGRSDLPILPISTGKMIVRLLPKILGHTHVANVGNVRMHAKSKIHSATEAALGFILTPLIRINEFLAVSIQRLDLFWGASASFGGGLSPPKPNA